ncbi:hypothetical protein NVV94_10240 [Pseudomonas sp. LS1212]|uniref:hypothetical protein n=1 Tax=Pseudomonas sp. LS1212 TaxID=2972478 RepID=UPI00215D45BE|nr:hypothetical protein [Pseudomonas sp. LS1212]UVJ45885.1 hypothetical protein NVV94_10240 [Pseudomonas sp. LS1212]
MGNLDKGIVRLLLIVCAIGSSISLPVQAAGEGVIVIKREVQPRIATRPTMAPDPKPVATNTDYSKQVISSTELSDGDFAGVSSGSTVTRVLSPDGGAMRALTGSQAQLPGMASGRTGASTNGISNTINRSVDRGMGALQILSRDR